MFKANCVLKSIGAEFDLEIIDRTSVADALENAKKGDAESTNRLAEWLLQNVERKVRAALCGRSHPMTQSSLVGHVVVKLVRGQTIQNATNVGYLHAAIAQATRETLIDEYRRRERRQNGFAKLGTDDRPFLRHCDTGDEQFVELHNALARLNEIDARKATVVTYRFLCGMSIAETAAELGVSESTVEADWRAARAWLYMQFKPE